jgi:hypothetical protein
MESLRAYIHEVVKAYHGTYADFDQFKAVDNQDFGYHFGTLDQAKKRLVQKPQEQEYFGHTYKGQKLPEPDKDGLIMVVELDINSPLRIEEERGGSWQPEVIVGSIIEGLNPDWVTEEEKNRFWDDELIVDRDGDPIWGHSRHEVAEQKVWLTKWLESKGFDSIVYGNKFEGGGDSYIVFHPEQIRIMKKVPYSGA